MFFFSIFKIQKFLLFWIFPLSRIHFLSWDFPFHPSHFVAAGPLSFFSHAPSQFSPQPPPFLLSLPGGPALSPASSASSSQLPSPCCVRVGHECSIVPVLVSPIPGPLKAHRLCPFLCIVVLSQSPKPLASIPFPSRRILLKKPPPPMLVLVGLHRRPCLSVCVVATVGFISSRSMWFSPPRRLSLARPPSPLSSPKPVMPPSTGSHRR